MLLLYLCKYLAEWREIADIEFKVARIHIIISYTTSHMHSMNLSQIVEFVSTKVIEI